MNNNQTNNQTYRNVDGDQEFVPTGVSRIPRVGEFYVSTRYSPGRVKQRSATTADSSFSGKKTIVRPVGNTSDLLIGGDVSLHVGGATYRDSNGKSYVADGTVRNPRVGEFYVSNSTEPGVVHGPFSGKWTPRTPKVIVTPATGTANQTINSSDSVNWETCNEDFQAFAEGGGTFKDSNGNQFTFTGEVRFPNAGESYVSNNSAPGLVRTSETGEGFTTPKLIVTPREDDENGVSEPEATTSDSDDTVDESPARSVQSHVLANHIRNTTYTRIGRSIACMATVILPGTGATALLTGVGLSVANESDTFSAEAGRNIALLRALDSIASHL